MGVITKSEFEFEQRSRTYAEILSIESTALTKKYCLICTKPRILTKDGVIDWQCDQCVYQKAFQQRMEHVRQSLELNDKLGITCNTCKTL